MKEDRSMPEHLENVFNNVKNEVINLHAKMKIYNQLFDHSEERLELLTKTAPSFFRFVSFALRDDLFVSIASITEPGKRTTLNRVVNIVRQTLTFTPQKRLVS